ncbi:MAG: DUF983 domain-containing protein [Reyranella sp.]
MNTPKVSLVRAAFACRCPKCGQGRLFTGLLTIRDCCPVCGVDLQGSDSGDAPAIAVIFLLSPILIGAALAVEFRFSPPLWVHAVLWPVLGIPLAVLLMRPLKAAVVGIQFRHRAAEMEL